MIETKVKTAKKIAEETKDAYSFQNYASWTACADMLLKRGYSDQATEAILRSKWTRWAVAASGKRYGRTTADDLANFLDDPRNQCSERAVRELVEQTFSE